MATLYLPASLSSPLNTKTTVSSGASTSVPFVSLPLRPSIRRQCQKQRHGALASPTYRSHNKARVVFTTSALVDGESVVTEDTDELEDVGKLIDVPQKGKTRPCELYFCNIPRSCDVPDIRELFSRFGTIISVEICRIPETGESRGSGYITLDSVESARKAISELDGTDLGGREMRVRFSTQMKLGNRNPKGLNSGPTKSLYYESPHKIYVGNLDYYIRPETLRYHFKSFGTVVSARVVFDRKEGKVRCYGFLSFSSEAERNAALSLDGTVFGTRPIIVRRGVENTQQ